MALLSGGLDSMLAIRLMQVQGLAVEALNFKTVFTCCQDQAGQVARDLGVNITVVGQDDDYLELVQNPEFGYGKGANPCVDCRIYMFRKAKRLMTQIGADFIVSGEVIGQRPMSQKRRDLAIISHHSELDDLLLRPLSAKLLPPTLPERQGWVDRDQLFDFCGRSRKGLLELARELDLPYLPQPSTGCALTEPRFARKVFDLIESPSEKSRWNFELLKYGRHFRYNVDCKVVVGRDESDNAQLQYMHESAHSCSSAMAAPLNFAGPRALLVGPVSDRAIAFLGGLVLRYSKPPANQEAVLVLERGGRSEQIRAHVDEQARHALTVATY